MDQTHAQWWSPGELLHQLLLMSVGTVVGVLDVRNTVYYQLVMNLFTLIVRCHAFACLRVSILYTCPILKCVTAQCGGGNTTVFPLRHREILEWVELYTTQQRVDSCQLASLFPDRTFVFAFRFGVCVVLW